MYIKTLPLSSQFLCTFCILMVITAVNRKLSLNAIPSRSSRKHKPKPSMYERLKYIYNKWFGPLTTFEGDTIATLMHISTLMGRNRLQRRICMLFSVFAGVCVLDFLCYVIYSRPSRKEIIGFLTLQVAALHYSVAYFIVQKYTGMYSEIMELFLKNCKPINTGGEKIAGIIKKESKVTIRLVFVFLAVLAVNLTLFLPWTGDEDKINFAVYRIKKYLGDSLFGTFLQIGVYSFCYHGAYVASIPMFAVIYYMLHIKFQFVLLTEKVEKLSLLGSKNSSDLIIYDVNFQKKVKRRLVSCIRHHQGIKRLKQTLDKIAYWPTLMLASSVVLFETSLIIFYLSNICPSSNYRMIFTWSVTTLGHTVYAMVGQTIVDESEKLYTALKCSNSYKWDKNNCCLLTIFLTNTQKPMQITSSGIIVVSKELILKSYKVLYSLITFYKSMSTKGD